MDYFKIGVLDADDYQFTLRALEQSSDVNLISNPSIVCLSGKEAKILIGSSEPYEIIHYDEAGNISTKETKFVDVGIKLTVTPTISEEGFVTMEIHPEVSSPRKGTVATEELAVDTTEATTVVTVKDGNTVVLGGLTKELKETNISKIPFLGDIPFLGALFRNTYTKRTKKELIIFLTPKILNERKEMLDRVLRQMEKTLKGN
jgi:general secretion pathway protein D